MSPYNHNRCEPCREYVPPRSHRCPRPCPPPPRPPKPCSPCNEYSSCGKKHRHDWDDGGWDRPPHHGSCDHKDKCNLFKLSYAVTDANGVEYIAMMYVMPDGEAGEVIYVSVATGQPGTPMAPVMASPKVLPLEVVETDTGVDLVVDDTVAGSITLPTDTVVDNGDGTFTITQTDGTTAVVAAPSAAGATDTVVDNGDSTFTITQTDGTTAVVPAVSTATDTVVDNGDGTFTITQSDGTTAVVGAAVTDTVVDNGDGTFTFTQTDGTTATVGGAVTDTLADNGDNTVTITQTDGAAATVWSAMATTSLVAAGSELTYTGLDGATTTVDVCALVADNCNATVADNGDNTITATDNAGVETVIPVGGVTSVAVDDSVAGQQTITYTLTDGTTVVAGPFAVQP